jgi:membrane-bound lytic murein transglycosylase MltF
MKSFCAVLVVLTLLLAAFPFPAHAARRGFKADTGTYTGDLDALLEHRVLRVAVPFSRTLFFFDKGHQRGLAAEAIGELESGLKKAYHGKLSLSVVVTPMTFDRLIPSVVEGKADVAIGHITVTPERFKAVDFTGPAMDPMNEIVVTGPNAPELKSLDDLAAREVYVRAATSYRQSLESLNERFAREGKKPVRIVLLPEELQDEDVLDMLNAGLIQITVKDDRLVKLWKPFLPHITLHPDLILRDGGVIAWAIRKNSPKLMALLDGMIVESTRKGLPRASYNQFVRDAGKMRNARSDEDMRRFQELVGLFRKYGGQYSFDSLLLMAQGYQESKLDQSAKSPGGAIGVMQIMPATGRFLAVGDIRQVEPNIHGGAKYLGQLMDKYIDDASLDEMNRTLLAFAGYNAGADRIARIRDTAAKNGLDPNVWFNNVEVVVAREMGQGPVRYVRNIFKYYVAYKLEEQARPKHDKAVQKGG